MKRFLCFLSALLLLFLWGCHASGVTVVEGQRESTVSEVVVTTGFTEQVTILTEASAPTPAEETTEEIPETTSAPTEEETLEESDARDYILNTNSKKFHYPTCGSVKQMKDSNKQEYHGTREELIAQGYDPCGNCHP